MSVFTPEEKRQFVRLLDKLRAQMRELVSLKTLEARSAVK
jgi:hypothetical protein